MRPSIFAALPLAAALAACTQRETPTAPLADAVALNSAGFIGDRPYSWTVKCSGKISSIANWSWTGSGVTIAGTTVSVTCDPAGSSISGAGTRPAAADGFTACVNYISCQSWTFDPSGSFGTQLKGTISVLDLPNPKCVFNPFSHNSQSCYQTATATLTVDS